MDDSCQYLCSELVTVTYEHQPGKIRQTMGNLEEISTHNAVVLLDDKPSLGASISLAVKDCDLFGIVSARIYDATLGWFAIVAWDAASLWSRDWFSPKHLVAICEFSLKGTTRTKGRTSENTTNTEENLPANFVLSEA